MTKAENRQNWILYGAYGYTGELVLEEALARGRRPIIAGRNEAKLKPLAEKHGLQYRAFSVEEASANLGGAGTLINCAGPFEITAEPMLDACLECGLNYLDITGEIPVFQAAHKRHEAAVQAEVILCPGVGFDIVPTDCLAALLKQALPDATSLELAFDFGTLPSMGTTVTAINAIGSGGMIRENGELKSVGHGYRILKIAFPNAPQWGTSMPWGDIYTSQISTGIPNAIVYAALPWAACWGFKMINPVRGFLARPGMQKMLIALAGKFLDDGPDADARKNHRTCFWGRVSAEDGRAYSGTIEAPSTYAMTAETAVAIALESENRDSSGGYFTASMLVGADFLTKRRGYSVTLSQEQNDSIQAVV